MLKDKLLEYYDEETVSKIINAYNEKRYTTFRVNTLKSNIDEIKSVLNENKVNYKLSNIQNSFILLDDFDIRSLDIYNEGKIYVQSLSSMLPAIYMDLNENESVLDMTAAPGGKTSLMASLANIKLTAIEKNKIRSDRLKYNLDKLCVKRCTILNVDARNIDPFYRFDRILLDAPCSGTGTLNKEEYDKFSMELVDRSVKTQTELLNKASELLKVGGTLVYSTCSILKCENEEQIEKLLNTGKFKIISLTTNIPLLPSTIDGVMTVMPSNIYEGFFVCKLEKIK